MASLLTRLAFAAAVAALAAGCNSESGRIPARAYAPIPGDTLDLIRALSRQMSDEHIASILNRAGKVTGKGLTWNRSRICSVRSNHEIPVYREGERQERKELTLDEAATILDVSPSTVRRLIKTGEFAANQTCKGAPWIIRLDEVQKESVRKAADARRARRPASRDSNQITMQL